VIVLENDENIASMPCVCTAYRGEANQETYIFKGIQNE
jgi:hypothetical protein